MTSVDTSNPETPEAAVSPLDAAFRFPPEIADDTELVALGQAMIAQYKAESFGIPISVGQTMLMAQDITQFLMLKFYEHNGWPTQGARQESRQAELVGKWIAVHNAWNGLLGKSQDKVLSTAVGEFRDAILRVVQLESDPEVRRRLLKAFQAEFDKLGY